MKIIEWDNINAEDELYQIGRYFKGVNSCCDYAIVIREYDNDHCIVDIWDIEVSQLDCDLNNGDMIRFFKPAYNLEYTIELWGKCYMLKTYAEQPLQMYYQGEDDKNIHDVIAELHKDAIKYGLEVSKIELY